MIAYESLKSQGAAEVLCDLRSDTVTKPCAGMRQAMAGAEVGDDVYDEDPTVNLLQSRLAEMTGKEAALFLTSGTQSNLTALLAHCGRGEAVIVGAPYHVFVDEAHGASVLGGIALQPVPVTSGGDILPETVRDWVMPDDCHCPVSRLLSLENTVGGQAIPLDRIAAGVEVARDHDLSAHLDGARFFNAITALGCSATDLAGPFDTVSLCLSKGLGTPAGSVLVGPRDVIARAYRARKMLGGAMRQSGVLAAAALYSLDHVLPRLAEDHARAEALAGVLRELGLGEVHQATNMVFLTPAPDIRDALYAHVRGQGILIGEGRQSRMVLHRDVDDTALAAAVSAFETFG